MSQVYRCSCGTRTTDPYIIRGETLCVLCAQEQAPSIVEKRIRGMERAERSRNVADASMRRSRASW